MAFLKALLFTILYVVFIGLMSLWVLLVDFHEMEFLFDYIHVINGIFSIISVFIFVRLMKTSETKLPQETQLKWYLFAFIIGGIYFFIQIPLNVIYYFIAGSEYNVSIIFDGFTNFNNANVIAIILLIPIVEELFFREFLQQNLQKKFKPIIAILIASFFFASIHLPYEALILTEINLSPHRAYIALFGGLISGILYYKSKSIGPSIVMHVMWNLVVTLA